MLSHLLCKTGRCSLNTASQIFAVFDCFIMLIESLYFCTVGRAKQAILRHNLELTELVMGFFDFICSIINRIVISWVPCYVCYDAQ